MLPASINEILKEIQSSDVEEFYISITNKALEWAICGFVEEANQLLDMLWNFGFVHSEQLQSANQGL